MIRRWDENKIYVQQKATPQVRLLRQHVALMRKGSSPHKDPTTELQRVLLEQFRAGREFESNHKRHPRLAIMDLSDWVAEELLVHAELESSYPVTRKLPVTTILAPGSSRLSDDSPVNLLSSNDNGTTL